LPAKGAKSFVTRVANQTSVGVNVIEGGDASGNNATRIGKCVVADLPPGLPKGTAIHVFFHYTSNGRLKVSAQLPDAKRQATSLIERSSGMSDAIRDEWERRMQEGLFHEEEEKPQSAPTSEGKKDWEPGGFSIDQSTSQDVVIEDVDDDNVILMDDDEEAVIEAIDGSESSDADLDDFFRSQNS
jgi:molecular chaperone DnaK (HSP70)